MRALFSAAAAALFFLISLVPAVAASDPQLAAIDAQASYMGTDFTAEYTVVQKKPDQGETSTTMAVFRRDSEDKYVLVLLKPDSDKGKGVLRVGNNLWKYDPTSKRFDVTSAKDRFQNSNVRFSDFNASTLAVDYKVVSKGSEHLGKLDTTVFSLESSNDEVTFPKVKIWVTADNLIRKREDYSLSGQLLRTTAIPSYNKLGSYSVPSNIIILDQLSGKVVNGVFVNERTLVTIAKPKFEKLGDLTFSQSYLEKLGR